MPHTTSLDYGTTSPTIDITYPDGTEITKTNNSRGLLSSIDLGMSSVLSRSYNDGGQQTSQTFGNSVTETRTYNTDGTLASLAGPGGTFAYTYDDNKNRSVAQIACNRGSQSDQEVVIG